MLVFHIHALSHYRDGDDVERVWIEELLDCCNSLLANDEII